MRATRARPVWAVLLALVIAAPAFAASLTVVDVPFADSSDTYDVKIAYPRTGVVDIDTAIATWATGLADGFIKQAREDFAEFAQGGDRPNLSYSLYLGYDVARNDDAMFVVDFDQSVFTGGAHPNPGIRTYNFLRPDGWQVFLPEIFEPAALQRISDLAIADLNDQFGPDSMSDADWLKTGAGPQWQNFEDFILLADALVIRFPPYQVAAYAAGPQKVSIPLSALDGLMRDDWRTPVPSFDCAKAGNPTETAICSDVALARLDRELAGSYRQSLTYADETQAAATRDAQRVWLGERNACGGSLVCLTESYDNRLAALRAN